MCFRLLPKWVTLNELERPNGLYFSLFHRIRVRCRCKTIITPIPRLQNLLLIVYDLYHLRNYSAIIWAKQTLITRFDGRRCTDD